MSDVKRYPVLIFGHPKHVVLASDFDRLEQECERLRDALRNAGKGIHWLQAHVPMGKDAQWHAYETRAAIEAALVAKP